MIWSKVMVSVTHILIQPTEKPQKPMNTVQIVQAAAAYSYCDSKSQLTLVLVRDTKVGSKANIFAVKAVKTSGVHSLSCGETQGRL